MAKLESHNGLEFGSKDDNYCEPEVHLSIKLLLRRTLVRSAILFGNVQQSLLIANSFAVRGLTIRIKKPERSVASKAS
jgi:hypothetical protein